MEQGIFTPGEGGTSHVCTSADLSLLSRCWGCFKRRASHGISTHLSRSGTPRASRPCGMTRSGDESCGRACPVTRHQRPRGSRKAQGGPGADRRHERSRGQAWARVLQHAHQGVHCTGGHGVSTAGGCRSPVSRLWSYQAARFSIVAVLTRSSFPLTAAVKLSVMASACF